ncbi:hypothetical protein [Candidatus Ichthyocystis sparus]|uniref:hypothetical protein n=1 Tax=Candidatus Ichthyocystis sparus TaxID=1561004 RepID=UPI000B818EE2|nr:hypothetical protein [Candidatus Ichthyocystis sparus]
MITFASFSTLDCTCISPPNLYLHLNFASSYTIDTAVDNDMGARLPALLNLCFPPSLPPAVESSVSIGGRVSSSHWSNAQRV